MRKNLIAVLSFVFFAIPSFAQSRHQSYISYDDGQAVLRQDDGRTVDARVNVPIFPGDELETGRRGRSEVRLADGNMVALDRNTAIRFQSILESYEGDSEQTVAELLFGSAMVHAVRGETSIRIDTTNATYVSRSRTLYSVDSSDRGSDEIAVFSGSLEVRTPEGSERIRAGERVRVDRNGISGSVVAAAYGDSDFERWYIRRAERYGRTSRYLDRRLAYADYDLDGYGSWVYVNDYSSWVWRPYVSAGWRPYYYGRWGHSRYGSLVWISDEPWGWVPYHYGRWAFSPVYGWLWVPGAAYSHAWVYWAFGSRYIGWIPAGFYDCYGPYYRWAYRPYANVGFDVGFGFHGRIRFANIDYRAWTFVDPNSLVSHRADRAALTTDSIRERLSRDGDRATVTNAFPRLSREQLKDPSSAIGVIARRGAGSGTGKDGSGSTTDLTPFFRRDPELPSAIRDRIARPIAGGVERSDDAGSSAAGRISRGGGGSGTDAGSRGSGGVIDRRPSDSSRSTGESGRIIPRVPQAVPEREVEQRDSGQVIPRRPETVPERQPLEREGGIVPRRGDPSPTPDSDESSWRGRVIPRETGSEPLERDRGSAASAPDWRDRSLGRDGERQPIAQPRRDSGSAGSDDIPRRVIDRIGGTRLEPTDRTARPRSDSGGGGRSIPRAERSESRPSSGGGGQVARPAPSSPPPQSAPSSGSSDRGSTNIKPKDN